MEQSYAGLWKRILAFATDYLIIFLYILLISLLSALVFWAAPNLQQVLFGDPVSGQITGFLIITLPVTLYFALFESSSHQATWGKRKQGLKVIHPNGEQLSRMQSLARTALKFIPWELAHTCIWQLDFNTGEISTTTLVGFIIVWLLVGVYIVTLLNSSKKQTFYDLLTNTYVVAD